jgi:hypothetical protein
VASGGCVGFVAGIVAFQAIGFDPVEWSPELGQAMAQFEEQSSILTMNISAGGCSGDPAESYACCMQDTGDHNYCCALNPAGCPGSSSYSSVSSCSGGPTGGYDCCMQEVGDESYCCALNPAGCPGSSSYSSYSSAFSSENPEPPSSENSSSPC